MKNQKAYTAFIVRDTAKRQYFNADSPRGSRWGRFNESSVYDTELDAIRTAYNINSSSDRPRAQVVPVTLLKTNR